MKYKLIITCGYESDSECVSAGVALFYKLKKENPEYQINWICKFIDFSVGVVNKELIVVPACPVSENIESIDIYYLGHASDGQISGLGNGVGTDIAANLFWILISETVESVYGASMLIAIDENKIAQKIIIMSCNLAKYDIAIKSLISSPVAKLFKKIVFWKSYVSIFSFSSLRFIPNLISIENLRNNIIDIQIDFLRSILLIRPVIEFKTFFDLLSEELSCFSNPVLTSENEKSIFKIINNQYNKNNLQDTIKSLNQYSMLNLIGRRIVQHKFVSEIQSKNRYWFSGQQAGVICIQPNNFSRDVKQIYESDEWECIETTPIKRAFIKAP